MTGWRKLALAREGEQLAKKQVCFGILFILAGNFQQFRLADYPLRLAGMALSRNKSKQNFLLLNRF